jgi:hypothetical protein
VMLSGAQEPEVFERVLCKVLDVPPAPAAA